MNDDFGPPLDAAADEADMIANLPGHLRSLCCSPNQPWVGTGSEPMHHDHGHTGCYFMNLGADEIERVRADNEELRQWMSDACELLHELIPELPSFTGFPARVVALLRRAENP